MTRLLSSTAVNSGDSDGDGDGIMAVTPTATECEPWGNLDRGMRTTQLPMDRLIRPVMMLVALALSAAACDRSSQNRALPEAETQSDPVVKSLGRIAALNKRVVTITVAPVPQRTVDDAFATEQFQRFKAAMLALDPHADVAIVKIVVRHASSGPFAFTKTHAFVFAADETGFGNTQQTSTTNSFACICRRRPDSSVVGRA